jgi:xylulokinase
VATAQLASSNMTAPRDLYLGIDLGTGSVKTVLMDLTGRIIDHASVEYAVVAPQPGWAESDPEEWWRALTSAVRQVVGDAPGRVRAIGFSGQMHGLVLAGANGDALRPAMLWADGRADKQLEGWRAVPQHLRARTANPLVAGMTGPLLRWVADEQPTSYQRARWALQPKDWIRLRATGEANSEPSDASATLLYDLVSDRWDDELLQAIDLDPRLLAPLVPSGSVVGELNGPAAAAFGLPGGVPVAAGAADTAAAVLGSGLRGVGTVQITLGTGGQLVTPSEVLPAAATGIHRYRTARERGWYGMAATLNVGLVLRWVCTVLGVDWAQLHEAAAGGPRPDDPLFLPHLAGERTPYLSSKMRGAWTDLTLSHDRDALLRSALEGVVFAVRDALEALPLGTDREPHIRTAGGGTASPVVRQLLADVLDRPIHALEVIEASGRGAALLGAIAVGDVTFEDVDGPLAPREALAAEPVSTTVAAHAERFLRFRAAIAALRP